MRRSADFADAVRGGARSGTRTVVVHRRQPTSGSDNSPLVGFVVSKSVGNAVERNQVKRRLRSIMATRLAELEPGGKIVVRALPAAKDATSQTLAADVETAIASTGRKLARRTLSS